MRYSQKIKIKKYKKMINKLKIKIKRLIKNLRKLIENPNLVIRIRRKILKTYWGKRWIKKIKTIRLTC